MGDDAASRLSALVDGLQRSGIRPSIVAARYAASWPKELTVREIPIYRPAPAPRSDWSMVRYARSLTNWLREQAPAYDLLYADAMREEAAIVIDAAKRAGIPSVVRYSGIGKFSDAAWWQSSRSAKRCKSVCLKADAIIAVRASAEQELLSAGVPRQRIHRIDNGFLPGPAREESTRLAARSALSHVNSDLFVPVDGKVLLTTNRMTDQGGLQSLVNALPAVFDRHPTLRVWLVGDGNQREDLYDYLRSHGVHSLVSMPGSFTSFEELLLAADYYALPQSTDGMEYYLPRVLGAGLPAVVADTVETRRLLGDSFADVIPFAAESPQSIGRAVDAMLADDASAQEAARRVRQAVLQVSFGNTVAQHLRLFCQLSGKNVTGNPTTAELLP